MKPCLVWHQYTCKEKQLLQKSDQIENFFMGRDLHYHFKLDDWEYTKLEQYYMDHYYVILGNWRNKNTIPIHTHRDDDN